MPSSFPSMSYESVTGAANPAERQRGLASSEPAVDIRNLNKAFKNLPVLLDISFQVKRGGVYALVGPDGAGKSTLIRILCGLLSPDSGSVKILGLDAREKAGELRRRTGYLSQRFSLYGDLSIDENIAFSAEIFGMKNFRERRNELLEMTGLTPFRKRPADKLSGGMRQKLALACTLVHDPELILLDEPTNGVDPVSRREFWKLLRNLGSRGITLLMSTPYLDEAERADEVAFLHEGHLILSGAPSEIRGSWDRSLLELFCDHNRDAAQVLADLYPDAEIQIFGDRVHLVIPLGGPEISEVASGLAAAGISVKHFGTARTSLENVFLSRIREVERHD